MRLKTKPISRAFSLVELLVTIAIIAVLGTILTVVVQRAIQSAKLSQLGSNMRQVHMGLLNYAADHDNRLPATSRNDITGLSTGGDSSWQAVVDPYVGNEAANGWRDAETIWDSVFHDPLDDTEKPGNVRPIRNIAINGYEARNQQTGEIYSSSGISTRNLDTIYFPAQTLALTTGAPGEDGDEYNGAAMRVRNVNYTNNVTRPRLTRVQGQYYCVFVDGHLEVLDEARILEEASDGGSSIFFDPSGNNAGR